MGKRGPKPRLTIKEKWTPGLAYAVGLITTDGCLYNDGLCVDLTSKDKEQIINYKHCLGLNNKIGIKWSKNGKKYYRIQVKNRMFYDFLESVGLTKNKSKTLGEIKLPDKYFFDFLRGCFDGDGTFYSYWDSRWKSSHMFYLEFTSASKKHIIWLRSEIKKFVKVSGHLTNLKNGKVIQLKYAKKEGMEIIKKMYYNPKVVCLSRKRKKVYKTLDIERRQQRKYAQMVELVYTHD